MLHTIGEGIKASKVIIITDAKSEYMTKTKQDFIEKWIGWVSYTEREKLRIEMNNDLESIFSSLLTDYTKWLRQNNHLQSAPFPSLVQRFKTRKS